MKYEYNKTENERMNFHLIDSRELLKTRNSKLETKTKTEFTVVIVYDKKNDNQRTISLSGFENDLDGGLPFWPEKMISDKEMICFFTAKQLFKIG